MLPRSLLRILSVLLLTPAVVPADPTPAEQSPAPAQPARAAGRGFIGQIQRASAGPWGEVEYTRIVIEPPDEFVFSDYRFRDHAEWHFPGYDQSKLEALWQAAGLDAEQIATLRDPAVVSRNLRGSTVRAPAALLRGLSPRSRTHLYNVLATLDGNTLHQIPFRFRADMVDEWLDEPDLPPAALDEVRRLLYRRGNSMVFSDPDLVLAMLPDAAARVRFVKMLSRKSALLVRLRVGPGTDVAALTRYWGRGTRRKDVEPLLRSLARHPDGIALDIAHLLPRFARGFLYTFPPRTEKEDKSHDCHWTSMNFFRAEPDEHFADLDFVLETLSNDYVRVPPSAPRQFGDVLLCTRPNGDIVHSCVYVADDIVFTKNGYSYQMPWTLNTMADMLAAYPDEATLEIHVFRRIVDADPRALPAGSVVPGKRGR